MPALSTDVLKGEPYHVVTYANVTTAIGVDTTATPDTDVVLASASLNSTTNVSEAFTFVDTTGLLTINCSGVYAVDVNCLFAATLAAGAVQSIKLNVGATGAFVLPTDLQNFREEGTAADKVWVGFCGITPYLTETTLMRIVFSSDTANDDALVHSIHWRIRRVPGVPGSAA